MKKNLFLIGFAAIGMLFASCSNDETVEVKKNTNAIQFKSFVNNSTRATDLTTTNLVDFQVWGIMKKDNHLTSSSCHPKFFVKEFCYFLMSCHQHCLGIDLLVQR